MGTHTTTNSATVRLAGYRVLPIHRADVGLTAVEDSGSGWLGWVDQTGAVLSPSTAARRHGDDTLTDPLAPVTS